MSMRTRDECIAALRDIKADDHPDSAPVLHQFADIIADEVEAPESMADHFDHLFDDLPEGVHMLLAETAYYSGIDEEGVAMRMLAASAVFAE
jgi:hypothetical protein